MGDQTQYLARMDAVNYALNVDDGLRTKDYEQADIILTGVSRSGKTPTCLYMALHYGVRAANYPITEDDMDKGRLPDALMPHKDRWFGLTITPERLQRIRSERKPNSRYASLAQCQTEARWAESLFRRHRVPQIDSTTMSIEEIAVSILHKFGLERESY